MKKSTKMSRYLWSVLDFMNHKIPASMQGDYSIGDYLFAIYKWRIKKQNPEWGWISTEDLILLDRLECWYYQNFPKV